MRIEAFISYTFQFLHGVMCDGQYKIGPIFSFKITNGLQVLKCSKEQLYSA